jgi:hypothetical protein
MPEVDLKTAWIVLDGGHLIDILSARKTFDDVLEYAKELYRATRMNFTEKALLAHYNSGTTVRDAAFENLPRRPTSPRRSTFSSRNQRRTWRRR